MRFRIGDKVKYDGGDWLFYGTVNAIFEHSISPCYRINVDRMEKKSCKLAIAQFEFELEAVVDDDNGVEKRKWDSAEPVEVVEGTFEPIETKKKRGGGRKKKEETAPIEPIKNKGGRPKKILVAEQEPQSIAMVKESVMEMVEKEAEVKGVSKTPERNTPEQKKIGRPKKEQEPVKKRLTWNDYFEKYKNGERSHAIDVWASQNRKEYKTGKMNEEKKDMLIKIRFPMMVVRKEKKRSYK